MLAQYSDLQCHKTSLCLSRWGGSMVKDTDCSSREHEFSSQHPSWAAQNCLQVPFPLSWGSWGSLHSNPHVLGLHVCATRLVLETLLIVRLEDCSHLMYRGHHTGSPPCGLGTHLWLQDLGGRGRRFRNLRPSLANRESEASLSYRRCCLKRENKNFMSVEIEKPWSKQCF